MAMSQQIKYGAGDDHHASSPSSTGGGGGGASLRAALRDVGAVQGIYHSGVRNMFATSAVAIAIAAFAFASKSRKELRIGMAAVSVAVLVFSTMYGLSVAKWHRDASRLLGEGIDTDETVAPAHRKHFGALARLLGSWESRVHAYVAIMAAIAIGILLATVFLTNAD